MNSLKEKLAEKSAPGNKSGGAKTTPSRVHAMLNTQLGVVEDEPECMFRVSHCIFHLICSNHRQHWYLQIILHIGNVAEFVMMVLELFIQAATYSMPKALLSAVCQLQAKLFSCTIEILYIILSTAAIVKS